MEAIGALAICGLAAVPELRRGDIPNVFPFAALIAAIVACAMDHEWLYHAIGLVLAIVCGSEAWKRGWIGGGAFKLGVGVSALAGAHVAGATLGLFAAVAGVFVLTAHFNILKPRTVPSTPVLAASIVTGVLLHGMTRAH